MRSRGYIAGKTATIATLKCLGRLEPPGLRRLPRRDLALALLGDRRRAGARRAAAGRGRTAAGRLLPVSVRLGIYPRAAGPGGALRPVDDARLLAVAARRRSAGCPPARCSATRVDRARRRIPPRSAGSDGGRWSLAFAALVVAGRARPQVALWFVAGAIAAFALFRGAGAAIVWGASKARPAAALPVLRLALANLHRPGAPTAQIVLSLGIGLTVLVAIALVEGNLAQ